VTADGHQAGAGAESGESGHGGGARFTARSGNYEDVAVKSLVRLLGARAEERRDELRSDKREIDGGIVLEHRRRSADPGEAPFAHLIAGGRQNVARLRGGKGDDVIGPDEFARDCSGVAGHAGGEIDRNDFGIRSEPVDQPDGFERYAPGFPGNAGTEHCIDDDIGEAKVQGNLNGESVLKAGESAGVQHLQIGGGIAAEVVGRGGQDDVEGFGGEAGVELARDCQTIASVVAPAADDYDAAVFQRRKLFYQQFDDAFGGIFHQDNAGDTAFDGAAINLVHLVRSKDLLRLCHQSCSESRFR